jgi:hypothetical protein
MPKEDKPITPFVQIKPRKDGIYVSWAYNALYNMKKDGKYSCYIPAFDIYYTAISLEEVKKKSDKLLRLYFDHFFIHNSGNKLKDVALQLHKLGFKSQNDAYIIHQYSKKQPNPIPSKFNGSERSRPADFWDANSFAHQANMKIAI